jgi:hypothetical protein
MSILISDDMEYPDLVGLTEILGWKDISTKRQKKNGTTIYKLPIKQYGQYIEVGSFESGYVRRMNGGYTAYQLNKCEPHIEYYKDYRTYHHGDGWKQEFTGKYNRFVGKRRIKINTKEERLEHLITYCLKNYYIKLANQVEDGKFVPKWKYDMKNRYTWSCGQITDNENGDIYVHDQHAYWNKWQEEKPSSVEIIIDGHRYKVK